MSITQIILTYRRENGPVLPLLPEEEVIQVIKWLKKSINQHMWVTVGGNKKSFCHHFGNEG